MESKVTKLFPMSINVEVDDPIARKFIVDGLDDFLDWLFKSHEFTAYEYLSEKEEALAEFLLSGGADE